MTFPDFDIIIKRFQELERKTSDTKGKEYANSEDRLGNFKRIAEDLNIDPIKVAYVFFKKHLDAITYVIKGKEELSESFEQRILDARLYLLLIYGLYLEKITEKEEKLS